MGWSYGLNGEGREVGYSVDAVCDKEGCGEEIDCGLAYVCGGMHGGGEYGCGRYFCYEHLQVGIPLPEQMCDACAQEFEADPELVERAVAEWNEEHSGREPHATLEYDRRTGDIAYVAGGSTML